VVDRLCQRLAQEGWNVLRDNKVMRPGELISGFMKRIGRADPSDRGLQQQVSAIDLLHDGAACYLQKRQATKAGVSRPHHSPNLG
jgi:hypothetical protein